MATVFLQHAVRKTCPNPVVSDSTRGRICDRRRTPFARSPSRLVPIGPSSPTESDLRQSKPETDSGTEFHHYPIYSPRFWHGMRPAAWWQLLSDGGRPDWSRMATAVSVTLATPVNSLGAWTQRAIYGRRLREAELHGPPVFIIGHWRSGTTLLHELMVRDERLSSPSTFQCFAPHHFLISEWLFRRFGSWLLPGKRPMDNMPAGWDRPQEDEFALMNLGLPSPYRRIAFPNRGPVDSDYFTLDEIDPDARRHWMQTLRQFLQAVSVATGRPLVIKSPTHTGRIRHLAAEFPEAKFVHITRDPRALFPSTCRLWKSLWELQGLQHPDFDSLPDYVIDCLGRMYDGFHRGREELDDTRLIDIRYEDLVAAPVATLRRVYESLRLCDFEPVQPSIEAWAETEHRDYQVNRHRLDEACEKRLRHAWADYFERYQYE